MNKTSISSVVCLDIIDFSKKAKTEQSKLKKQLDALVSIAVADIPEKDRMVVDTGHGVIITCSGPLENALEDALFIALTIRDEVLNSNADSLTPLYLLMGINLGSVRVEQSTNVNEPPNIVGDGLLEAQRIMSFANPNQILVSRAYYDMASKLTLEIAQMFEKYDMHAYEHDIYAVRLLKEKTAKTVDPLAAGDNEAAVAEGNESQEDALDWRLYILPILLGLIMLFILIKWMQSDDSDETQELTLPEVAEETTEEIMLEPGTEELVLPEDEATIEDSGAETAESSQDDTKKQAKKAVKTKTSKQSTSKATTSQSVPVETTDAYESTVVETTEDNEAEAGDEKSGWQKFKDSITQGAEVEEQECSQAERALNQCN